MPTQGAMHACCAVWYFGFCFLPWLWFTNVWLFWYDFVGRPGADPALKKCEFHVDASTCTGLITYAHAQLEAVTALTTLPPVPLTLSPYP